MINEQEYVELGLCCSDICRALERGINGKKLNELSQSVCEAISQLTMWVGPVIHSSDNSLMVLSITEQWQRSKGRSSNGAGGMQPPDFFMPRVIKKQLPVGT